MCNYLETVVSGVKTVQIKILGVEVSVARIYFGKSYITISSEAFEAIQNKLGRKYLKKLRAKVSFGLDLKPDRIEIEGISVPGLQERQLKSLGKFKKIHTMSVASRRPTTSR